MCIVLKCTTVSFIHSLLEGHLRFFPVFSNYQQSCHKHVSKVFYINMFSFPLDKSPWLGIAAYKIFFLHLWFSAVWLQGECSFLWLYHDWILLDFFIHASFIEFVRFSDIIPLYIFFSCTNISRLLLGIQWHRCQIFQ